MNTFTARSTIKFATIPDFLPTSITCAVSGTAPWRRNLFAEVFIDANHPFGISPAGISVPIQNPFNPFTVADYTSPGGSDLPPGTPLTTGVRYTALEAGPHTNKITTHDYEFTGGLKGNLAEFGDYFKTWNGKPDSAIMKTSVSSVKAGSWITMRCGRRYSTRIQQPPLIHSALIRTRPR